ncbi:hypothetical protein LEP1GSC075_2116 [Leptospira interrogans str. Kito]|nr:hypothetical protein LEP1GSC069_2607 [Leptospira interrogans serovar Canicola str. Fiocruz LV133]EMK23508.1 hypothetical protein LEP1GSC075_2116 [Leptospira interrogans str. Kito]EMN76083.1 hypothetical protein LEP1GSC102_3111 [Leptospira interrogans str. UI 09600]EMO01713.1 hypothetical protein LEP1GSC112_0954 [Leptospira interrogans serovar Pomona str. UT364]
MFKLDLTIYRNRNGIEVAPSGLIDLGGGPTGSVGIIFFLVVNSRI